MFAKNYFPLRTPDGFIVLDVKRDKYIIYDSEISEIINRHVSGDTLLSFELDKIRSLLRAGVIDNQVGEPYEIITRKGINDYTWRMRAYDPLKIVERRARAEVVFLILLSQLMIKIIGIERTINVGVVIRSIREYLGKTDNNKDMIYSGVDDIIVAARWAWMRFRCLEFAIAVRLYADICGVRTVFNIGVQRFPFVAHAWIEYLEIPVSDVRDISERIGVIYSRA